MDNKSNDDPQGRLSIILVTSAIPMHPKVKKYLVPRFLIKSSYLDKTRTIPPYSSVNTISFLIIDGSDRFGHCLSRFSKWSKKLRLNHRM